MRLRTRTSPPGCLARGAPETESSLTIAYARKGYVGGVLVILLLGRVRFGVFWVSLDFVSGLVWLASRTCC